MRLIVLSMVILAVVIAGMAIQVMVVKNGHFPEFRIGHNDVMKRKHIYCP